MRATHFVCATSLVLYSPTGALGTEMPKQFLASENIGKQITITGHYSQKGRYGAYITSNTIDQQIYILNGERFYKIGAKPAECDVVEVSGTLHVSPGYRMIQLGNPMVWVSTAEKPRKGTSAPMEYYYFDGNEISIHTLSDKQK